MMPNSSPANALRETSGQSSLFLQPFRAQAGQHLGTAVTAPPALDFLSLSWTGFVCGAAFPSHLRQSGLASVDPTRLLILALSP